MQQIVNNMYVRLIYDFLYVLNTSFFRVKILYFYLHLFFLFAHFVYCILFYSVVPFVYNERHNVENCVVNCSKNAADTAQNCDEIQETYKKHKKKKKRDKIKKQENSNKELLTVITSEIQNNEDTKINPKKRRRCISSSNENDNSKCVSSFVSDFYKEDVFIVPMEQNSSILQKIEIVTNNPVELISTQQNQVATKRKCLSLNDTLDFSKNSLNNTKFNKISVDTCNELSPNCTDKNITQISGNTSNPEQKTVSKRVLRKVYSGVGDLMTQLSNGEIIEAGSNFVTKRKRFRTRKRKTLNLEGSEIESVCSNNTERSIFVPPNTKAAPKIHIKFATNEDMENIVHSIPLNIKKNNNSYNGENKLYVNDFNIESLPAMTEVSEINSLILFKVSFFDYTVLNNIKT